MKHVPKFLGILCAFCLMIVFLFTSVEAVVYWTPGYFEQEYEKYHVPETVQMEMEDLLEVTDEMMDYLRGDREDLHVPTIVNGQPREFFNEREIAHMVDVKDLFLKAMALRRICLGIAAGCILLLFTRYRSEVRRTLPRMLCAGTGLFLLLTAALAGLISTNFTKYFIIFHEIFFTNDLWILDPRTDLLINIVPEPFFMDTAARIGITFALMVAALFIICIFFIKTEKKSGHASVKLSAFLLSLLLFTGSVPFDAQASVHWPSDLSIEADAGIVMDADTGTVLYGKNIHDTYAPASITKVLTTLIVLEHCSMDETVTFSQNAVYNVESNSSSAGYDTGDTASVKDCLYALMLKSANEVANALAEHISGSIEEFAVLMNETAKELGCKDSNFANPSGLNNENHYVSAYDMALITRAAFNNETFVMIAGTTYYELPPNKQNPEGQGVSPGNKLIKKNLPEYYRPDVLGGKTGYTSIALNTLVTGARQEDTTLVTVVLHSRGTQYTDTKRLLDFGFSNFHSLPLTDMEQTFSTLGKDLTLSGLTSSGQPTFRLAEDSSIILPKSAEFEETEYTLNYTLPDNAPDQAIALVEYTLGDHSVGQTYLLLAENSSGTEYLLPEELLEVNPSILSPEGMPSDNDSSPEAGTNTENSGNPNSDSAESKLRSSVPNDGNQDGFGKTSESETPVSGTAEGSSSPLSFLGKVILIILLLLGGGALFLYSLQRQRKKEEQAMQERRRRRAERLKETGISETEFNLMMQNRRNKNNKR